ncbi:MAG TPA: transposase [Spirochaetales bacterium]|nr:transposase [Spirochaetales bacterium]HQG39629.1 transposase [Spirochaetales bacterium]
MVVSYQSFGEFARFHPHWHVLVLEGGFTDRDRFVYLPLGVCINQQVARLCGT